MHQVVAESEEIQNAEIETFFLFSGVSRRNEKINFGEVEQGQLERGLACVEAWHKNAKRLSPKHNFYVVRCLYNPAQVKFSALAQAAGPAVAPSVIRTHSRSLIYTL